MHQCLLVLTGLCFSFSTVAAAAAEAGNATPSRPNVVIVLVDDQGYGDLSCHGNPILKTPELDRLHQQSIRLTDFHVSPMCTPTRSQLLSGRDALDNGAMNVSSGRTMLRREIPTMADMFANSGYRTGIFGKWHLGDAYPYRPQDRGFQRAIWFPSSHIQAVPDYFNNDYFDPFLRLEDGSIERFKGYCTDVYFDEAMAWMKKQAGAREPFFAYIPLNAAHAPLYVPEKYREPYRELNANVASFFGMIANIDENMGRLESMLQRANLRENTILIFMTDNGGTAGVKTFNAGMRGSKITLWEGGHRVPCFIRWPAGGLGKPRDVDELTHVQDLLPTLIDVCRIEAPQEPRFDGISLAGLLRGQQEALPDRMLVVQFSYMDHQVPVKGEAAVLWKKWRLVSDKQLYDVRADLAQEHDIAAQHPEVVQKMRDHYARWWADVEPRVNELSDLVIGSEAEPETLLSAADWQDVFLDQQRQVRRGLERNGRWGVELARDGGYTFELRRWPRESDLPLTASTPPFHSEDEKMDPMGPGKALPIAKAKLRVGDFEATREAGEGDKFVAFDVPLTKGRTRVQTWFYDAEGKELCGAYYVYVSAKR